jgi:hypothetical protein
MNDKSSLEKYRRSQVREAYQAFKVVDREQPRLRLRPVWRAWERLSYGHLWRILENGTGTQIGLIFSFAAVIIKGKNLQTVADAIDQHRCEFVQEYDKDLWDMPTDASVPFIESIDIHTETRDEMILAADKFQDDAASQRSSGH